MPGLTSWPPWENCLPCRSSIFRTDAPLLGLLVREAAGSLVAVAVVRPAFDGVDDEVAFDACFAILIAHAMSSSSRFQEQSARRLHAMEAVIQDIERNDWGRFFESFTLAHDHWLVHVDGEKESLPLEGIIVRDNLITITLGGDISHHRRIVIDAVRVSVRQTGGVDEGVALESADGAVTRLRFRSPMPTELVDGVAP